MNTVGEILRGLRDSKQLLLREVAAELKMDTALLSKIERNERKPNKAQIMAFARFYQADPNELLVAWLSDKIASDIQNEELAKRVLKEAEKKVDLLKKSNKK
ncbi:MAG TPA: helix-turn-helix transcriptional regulator [Puia sp.]|nr:helix-turn-helix transcriptional regulator [Puia sp.]